LRRMNTIIVMAGNIARYWTILVDPIL
jgi:hypothetical protein